MTISPADLDKAKLDPASVFRAPEDVLAESGLSSDDKRSILVRWEADLEALLRATEEGMPPSDNRRSTRPSSLSRPLQPRTAPAASCFSNTAPGVRTRGNVERPSRVELFSPRLPRL